MGRHVPVAALLLAAGCAFRQPVPAQTFSNLEPTSDILAMDRAAWKLVAIQQKNIVRKDDGRLQVVLELANLSNKPVNIQVRTTFRDDKGMLMDDQTNWAMHTIVGNGTMAYDITSLKQNPGGFTVEIMTP